MTSTGVSSGEPQRTVMTVTGPVAADDIGIALVHEHIFEASRKCGIGAVPEVLG